MTAHIMACRMLVVAGLLSLACQGRSSAAQKSAPAVPVNVASVERRDVPVEVSAFGAVEASSTVDIVSQVTGLITEVHFKEGDFVNKGDSLFTIDTRPYQASLAVAVAELDKNRALLEQARTEAERTAKLHQSGIASDQDLAKAQTDAASAAATVQVSEAELRGASLNVAFTQIVAPLAGRTGSLLVHAGNVVHVGDKDPLVTIRSVSPVYVRFSLPQEYLPQIREHVGGNSPLTVRVTPRGTGAQPIEGLLTFFENSVDPATGTLAVKATFPNAGGELWPGATVDVVLVLGVDAGAVVAPVAAVQDGQHGTYAFVVDQQGHAHLHSVIVARATQSLAVIRSGLEPGDQVVTDGQVRLRDGISVEVKPSARDAEKATGSGGSAGAP